jgi:hypothetical protein
MDERHKVHYERIETHASPHGFAIPADVIKTLGRGDPEIGNAVLLETFGVHPMAVPHSSIHLQTVREIGGGDIEAGKRVIRKFIAKVRKHHATEGHAEGGAAKLSKHEVNYRQGNPNKKCGLCSMYRPNSCTAVAGHISPLAVCDIFDRRSHKSS